MFAGNNDYALTKLQTALAAGKAPDIAYQYGSSMAHLAKLPQVVDLTSRVNDPAFDWNDFFPAVRLAATVNGKVLGVPALVDNLALVYNKTLFDQAGVPYPTAQWTWNDFRAAAKKLTNPSTKQFGWAYVNDGSEDTVWRFLALLWQAGGDLLTPDNTQGGVQLAGGPQGDDAALRHGQPDNSIYLDSGNGNYLNLFNAGKIAMLWTGPWDISSINPGVQFGVQILPGDVSHATIAGPDNYVVLNNGADRVNGAWDFVKWFTSPQQHLQFAIATGDLPIRKSETKLPGVPDLPEEVPGRRRCSSPTSSNVTKARPNIPTYPKVSPALGQAVQAVLLGKMTPQQALCSAEQQVEQPSSPPAREQRCRDGRVSGADGSDAGRPRWPGPSGAPAAPARTAGRASLRTASSPATTSPAGCFVSPAVLLIGLFGVAPIIWALVISFQHNS